MKKAKLSPELVEEFKKDVQQRIELHATLCLNEIVAKILGESDIVLLDSMGIDGRQMLLQTIVDQAKIMLEE